MFKQVSSTLAIVTLGVLAGCGFSSEKKDVAPVQSHLKVVNVLSQEFYDDAHIAGSMHVDFEKVAAEAATWDKNDTVVFYCLNPMCRASFDAARTLQQMGFANAMAYEGGIAEWYQLMHKGDASYKVEGLAKQEYLQEEVKPSTIAPDASVKTVTAEQLKAMMIEAKLL